MMHTTPSQSLAPERPYARHAKLETLRVAKTLPLRSYGQPNKLRSFRVDQPESGK